MSWRTPEPDAAHRAEGPRAWPDRVRAAVDERLVRLGVTTELRRDGLLAVLLLVGSLALLGVVVADTVATGAPAAAFPVPVVGALLVGQALLLAVRRARPVACLLAVAALQGVLVAVLPDEFGTRFLPPLVAAYTCGARLPAGRAVRAVLGVALLESAVFVLVRTAAATTAPGRPAEVAGSVLAGLAGTVPADVLSMAAAAVIGAYVGARRQVVALLRDRAADAVRAQRARADAAVRTERSRMARELHDIAAHHLSGMVVQTAVVERLIDRDPAAAREAAAWLRRQGRETLHDLRLVVGALREPGAGDPGGPAVDGAPVPGTAALDRLVATARDLGDRVELVREGPLRDLPPIADVTVHRVAQEALANAREHAPGAPVRVVLRCSASTVALEVVNGTAGAPARAPDARRGFGLVGMRERAQMLGATFDAGPTPSGGWRVALAVPLRDLERSGPDVPRAPRDAVAEPSTGTGASG